MRRMFLLIGMVCVLVSLPSILVLSVLFFVMSDLDLEFIVMSVGFLMMPFAFGIGFMTGPIREMRRIRRLMRDGRRIEAKITNLYECSNVFYGNRPAFVMDCVYDDLKFRSDPILPLDSFDPTGHTVTVYYDQKNTDDYYIDLISAPCNQWRRIPDFQERW